MACNVCETGFQGSQSLVVSIEKSGSTANLFLKNQGRNILMIRRILLCYTQGSGTGFVFLRPPPDGVSWLYPSAFLEPESIALYFQLTAANLGLVQAQAEYIEIDGRSRSCPAT